MTIITAQHAARACEIHETFDAFHDEVEAVSTFFYTKVVNAAKSTAELAEAAAKVHASEKKSELSKRIIASRLSLRGMRHDMALIQMQTRLDDLKAKLSELQAMQLMAPLLDACPE
jgi:hypothetical protein